MDPGQNTLQDGTMLRHKRSSKQLKLSNALDAEIHK